MSLRSDFKIRALTPNTPSIAALQEKPSPTIDEILLKPETLDNQQVFHPPERTVFDPGDRTIRGVKTIAPGPRSRQVAFLVTHGMGQQVPFETLSALGQALITEHAKRSPDPTGDAGIHAEVRRVILTSSANAPELSRVEVAFENESGEKADVHIYESYWAPFTEGQISFVQTVSFLYSAAWNGIKTCVLSARRKEAKQKEAAGSQEGVQGLTGQGSPATRFDRWIFGDFYDMPIKRHTFLELTAAVFFLSLLLVPALLLFTPLGLSTGKWLFHSYEDRYLESPFIVQIGTALIAAVLFAFAWIVRYGVVEFVGDVAIYVSSYKVSRFDAIRDKILEEVCSVARQIYSAGISDRTHTRYDDIVIVGHSLGSVISYDVLNSCINWDQVECKFHRRVVERTTRLITFGSPLDKTAFLFRTQVSSARNLREALAARQQPLILDYDKFRPLGTFRWINIYAPADIISGRLAYYDVPDGSNVSGFNPVTNVPDPDARIPLFAHLAYWENPTLHGVLYEAAMARVAVAP
jgi:hypothetical protein